MFFFQMTNQYKVGVLYVKDGQSTEEEMYNNRKWTIESIGFNIFFVYTYNIYYWFYKVLQLFWFYKMSREIRALWLVRKSSLYFHKARTLHHTSALLRYNAHSLCHQYEHM